MRALGALRPFLLGAVAVGVVAYAFAGALAVAAQADGRSLTIGLGPVAVVSVSHGRPATVTTFGPGLVALALAGGLVNLSAAYLIRRRSRRPGDRVE